MDKLWDAIRKTMKDGKDRSVMIGFKRVKIHRNDDYTCISYRDNLCCIVVLTANAKKNIKKTLEL